MSFQFPGARHRTNSHAPAAGTFDAKALVAETLARHGLSGELPDMQGAGAGFDLSGLMSGLNSGLTSGLPQMQMPGGMPGAMPGGVARETFSCAAGSRDYIVHVPEGAVRGLVLMLHGCTQTPEDFATGTGMNAHADTHGLVVVYPAQNRGANAQSCWNWFSAGDQRRDRGEPAILAALVRDVAARHDVPAGRIFVAGLSAGAAMAVILGRTHGDLFAGIGAHSGLPYGCARSVPEAFAAMGGTPGQAASAPAPVVPSIVFHGDGDTTVAPVNSDRIVADAAGGAPVGSVIEDDGKAGGRAYRRATTLAADGGVLCEDWRIAGLGHAWSGGDGAGSYADPAGPDASAEMVRFFLSIADRKAVAA